MSKFSLDFDELINIDGIPRENIIFKINTADLIVDWDDELGSGSFAQVFKGWYLWTEVAIKRMALPNEGDDSTLMKYLKREVVLLNVLKHPNIVQFLGWCNPEDSNYLLLVEEYIKGGTLQNFINKKASRDIWAAKILLCADVAKAMLYLHKNNIVYRDLKCDNILIDDSTKPRFAKLVDFGFARTLVMENNVKGPPLTICGTDDWMAPEVILGMEYDERSDVFSFGVVLLECILGTENVKNKLQRKAHNCFELSTELARDLTPATCPEEVLELTLSCCAYDPNARPDFHDILTILTNAHRHLSECNTGGSDISTESPRPHVSVDLSHVSPSDEESSSGPPSATGSRDSKSGKAPESEAEPAQLLSTSPVSKSPLLPNLAGLKTEKKRNSGSTADSVADDEADDLRKIISQANIRHSIDAGSPRSQVDFALAALNISREDLRSSLNLLNLSGSCYDSLEYGNKKDYIRVESLVDEFTVWNVRIGTGATVADVCENLAKKVDAKYKYIELYQVYKRKRVLLYPEQFIEQIRNHWGGDNSYKFGVVYRSVETNSDTRTTKKWNSMKSSPSRRPSAKEIASAAKKKDKKKLVAMNVNFTLSPV